MRRGVVVGTSVGVAVLVAGVVVLGLHLRPTILVAERTGQAPAITTADATRDYLLGPGARLLDVHRAAKAHVDADDDDARCRDDADRLGAVIQPDEATDLIAGVPDEPLRAYLLDERDLLESGLARCARGEPPSSEELDVAVRSVDARLDDGGWPR